MASGPAASTVEEYIDALEEPRKSEIKEIFEFLRAIAPEKEIWVTKGIIGFGRYSYRSKSGCAGEWFDLGLASNKSSLAIYAIGYDDDGMIAERYKSRLPKADIGKSCIRFKRFSDLDKEVLTELLIKSKSCKSIGV